MPFEDVAIITRIVAQATGSRVVATRPIAGRGMVNRVYVAETLDARYIARLGTEHGAAQYRKEAWCYRHAADLGVPGPAVIAAGEIEGAAYLLLSHLSGVDGDAAGVDATRLWHTLGRYASRIHRIPVTGFGESLVDPVQGRFSETWDRYLAYNIASLTRDDVLLDLGVFSPAQSRQLRELFEHVRAVPLRVGLNHGDLATRNTIIDAGGCVYLLDWGSAGARVVPHHDIAQILSASLTTSTNPLFGAFLAGYGLTQDAFRALQPEIEAVALLRAIDLVRWALDRSPKDAGRCVAAAHIAVSQYLG